MVDRRAFTPNDPEARQKIRDDEIEARLQTLESAQGLRNASVKGGAITVWSKANKQVTRLGKGKYIIGGNTREAVTLAASTDTGGFHLLIDNEEGWVEPLVSNTFVQDTYIPVTSAGFVSTWKSALTMLGTTLVCELVVSADASTVGNVKLNMAGLDTDAINCPAGIFTTCRFSWDLKDRVPLGGLHVVRVFAQRVSGAGNINVYSPQFVYAATKTRRNDATIGGIASV